MEEENKNNGLIPKTREEVEKIMGNIVNNGLQIEDVDLLYKLIDIHKDIENECYWKIKEENMRYYNDNSYAGGRSRDAQGRYVDRGRRYRGEDMIDRVHDDYRNYNYGKDTYSGNTTQSLEYMMQSIVDFISMLQDEVDSQEEMDIVRRYSRKISEM